MLNKIKEKLTKNDYKNYPEVYKYFSICTSCIICSKEAFEYEKSCNSKNLIEDKRVIPVEVQKKPLPLYLKNFIENLKISKFDQIIKSDIKNKNNKDESIKSAELYINFLESIDLSNNIPLFKKIDEILFSKVLRFDLFDKNFANFVQKLENDPLNYTKQEKTSILNIIIFTIAYCNKFKIDTRKLKVKLEEISFLFIPNQKFMIDFQNDLDIDVYILQLRLNMYDLNEAIFMNKVYLNIAKNKKCFNIFHKRLYESLKLIDESNFISFLRYVFTHNTVLFSCIDELQLIKLIQSFYQNMNKNDNTVEILNLIIQKTEYCIHEPLIETLKRLCLSSNKYKKIYQSIEIRSCKSVDEVMKFIDNNKESFDSLNILFGDLKSISELLEFKNNIYTFLEIVVYFFKNIKTEFVENFFNGILQILINTLSKVTVIERELIDFNYKYWKDLSDIILISQRISIADESVKKKKGCDRISTQSGKNGLKLAQCIYRIEDLSVEFNIKDFIKLKERGFKIVGE